MKKYIIFTLLIVSFLSCTKTLDFDDEGFADQLVVNSIIWPDSIFKASVTKSTSILENRYAPRELVKDATIDLFENNQLLAHLTSTTGNFHAAGIKPKAGNTYKTVVTSGEKQITSETVIPNRAEIISIDTITVKGDYSSYKKIHFKIKMKDAPGEDYYRCVITHENLTTIRYKDSENKTFTRYYQYSENSMDSNDPVFKSVYNNTGEEILDMGPENRYYIFPDDLINGKEHFIDINTNFYYHPFETSNPQLNGTPEQIYSRFTVHVQHISKDLYQYLKYLELYNYYHDNPISEPVPVYSNVQNGAGIFAGFNDDAKYTYEKIYIPFSMDTIKIDNPTHGGGGGGYYYGAVN